VGDRDLVGLGPSDGRPRAAQGVDGHELVDVDAGGLLHLAGSDEGSWFDLAEVVFELAGRPELLSATTAAEFGAPALRAPYSALASDRLDELGLQPLPGWRDGLQRHFADAHAELPGMKKTRGRE